VLFVSCASNLTVREKSRKTHALLRGNHTRVYHFKRCRGSGCPYTASWLSHINLYRRVGWHLESTKMETASFNIFDRAMYKWQLSDPHAYYVHHMSMFEHLIHKKYGFDSAKNSTQVMSDKAFLSECSAHHHYGSGMRKYNANDGGNMSSSLDNMAHTSLHGTRKLKAKTMEYLALIPFYGGLPPAVTQDFSKVNSIGQGNSLVKPSIKVLQCMATVCSCLKYFGHVVIGVAREYDLELVTNKLKELDPRMARHIHVVLFNMPKPAHLPFHLLGWGQQFVRKHNCGLWKTLKDGVADRDNEVYDICKDKSGKLSWQHKGGPVNATQFFNFRQFEAPFPKNLDDSDNEKLLEMESSSKQPISTPPESVDTKEDAHVVDEDGSTKSFLKGKLHRPFRFVYYTEMDQIVRFDSIETFKALSTASNSSCFFVGRRKEKARDSDPADYMGDLNQWRECGEPGFSMKWPEEIHVRETFV
jgi:hypothetical protein